MNKLLASIPLTVKFSIVPALLLVLIGLDVFVYGAPPVLNLVSAVLLVVVSLAIGAATAADKLRPAVRTEPVVDLAALREEARREQEAESRKAEAGRHDALLHLAEDFHANVSATVQKVAGASQGMTVAAREMSGIAERNTRQARESSESAGHASVNIQTVAAAAEELSASITEISRQVIHAKETAQRAGEKAHLTTNIVRTLSQAVDSIGQVVSLINDIAGQTNLLALNATIEAARAGEAGKGFAVVANEVKHLATQTAKATGDIGGQIGAVQEATRQAVAAIDEIVQTIANITDVSMVIAAAVEEQQASTSEIVRNVSEVSVQTDMLAANIAGANDSATDAGRLAGQVFDSASGLSGLCGDLQRQVTDFLERFRRG